MEQRPSAGMARTVSARIIVEHAATMAGLPTGFDRSGVIGLFLKKFETSLGCVRSFLLFWSFQVVSFRL